MRKRLLALFFAMLITFSLCACQNDKVLLQNGMQSDDDSITAARNIDGTLTLSWTGLGARQAAEYFDGDSAYMCVEMPLANVEEKIVIKAFYFKGIGYEYHIYDITDTSTELFHGLVEDTESENEIPNLTFSEDGIQLILAADEYRSLPVSSIDYFQITVAQEYEDEVNKVTSAQYNLLEIITK